MVLFAPGATLTCWNAQVGGTQYTDLRNAVGGAVTSVTSGDGVTGPAGATPRFQAPDEVLTLWIDGGTGTRYLMVTTDLPALLAGKISRAGDSMDGDLLLADDSPAASRDYVDARAGGAPSILVFGYGGIVSPRAGVERIYNDVGRPLTIGTVRASAGTGPAGQALIVDVHKNGTTVYTNQAARPTIAAGQQTGTGGTPDAPVWSPGEYLTVDVDQVGTTTPGSDLTVTIVAS
ncbi:hypothetical protein GEV43_39915 [Actinomadura sp. J1-007]|nr:hypothetical protein [Actinomadura sp. J1-007]